MIEYDELGYVKNIPLKPDQWRSFVQNMPEGMVLTRNSTPPGFLLYQNFLDPGVCDAIVKEADAQAGIKHTVGKDEGGAGHLQTFNSEARISELVDIKHLSANIPAIVQAAYQQVVAPHYGVAIEWFEKPEILRYRTGGEYRPHSDSENWDDAARVWRRTIDRDFSILIYLNEGFAGGEIVFPNFGLRLAPKRGLLIAFPSDARYLHTAYPVTAGTRYALVSWAAAKGTERVKGMPPAFSYRMQ